MVVDKGAKGTRLLKMDAQQKYEWKWEPGLDDWLFSSLRHVDFSKGTQPTPKGLAKLLYAGPEFMAEYQKYADRDIAARAGIDATSVGRMRARGWHVDGS